MAEEISEETEAKAKQLGMTALELRALINPLYMALYQSARTSITITRVGPLVNVDIR